MIRNARDVTVRGATFSAGEGAVVWIDASSDVTLEGNDIHGQGTACTGVRIEGGSSDIRLLDNQIHDLADDGLEIHGARRLTVSGNAIYRLLAIGTDSKPPGPCYNGHSDGIEIFDVHDSVFAGNLVYDVRSTAALFFGNWADSPGEHCRNLRFENNVFFTPESGFVGYVTEARDVVFANNVFWRGIYGGIVIGNDVRGLDVVNNVLHSVNYRHSKEPYLAEEHRFRNNWIATTEAQGTPSIVDHDGNRVGRDPGFAGIPAIDAFGARETYRHERDAPAPLRLEDFAPKPGSALLDAGSEREAPGLDVLGRQRPAGAAPDIGAFEGPLGAR